MVRNKIFNTIFFAIAVYALYLKLPDILTHFKFQDQKAPDFRVKLIDGKNFTLSKEPRKLIVIFWATWCGPCEIELKRINEMISSNKIIPEDVLAISSGEDENLVRATVKNKSYHFNVGIDADGSIARQYQVTATPTITFIDNKQIIHWMTAGISPTLEFRISSFIK